MIRYLFYSQPTTYILSFFFFQQKEQGSQLYCLKPDLTPSKKNYFASFNSDRYQPFSLHFNTPVSKMMKNAFYFIFKTSLFSRYFDFFLEFLGTCRKSRLIKDKVKISKFMMPYHHSTACWLTKRITIQALFNIYHKTG